VKLTELHSAAQSELDRAVAYYEGERAGLGLEFLAEVEAEVALIRRNPKLRGRCQATEFRKSVLRRFPYVIFYREREETIWIAAVAHAKRRPGYWMRRRPED
jgi:toxin ParE1/3/4